MPTPTAVAIHLADGERARLEAWSRRRKTAQALALRSRIVLAAADGAANYEIAEQLAISRPTVTKWRNRFAERRLDGLLDEPRPGRPTTVTDETVERIVTTTLESTPKDATHWSTRSLAAHLGVSQDAVWRTWQAFSLQPHRGGQVWRPPWDKEDPCRPSLLRLAQAQRGRPEPAAPRSPSRHPFSQSPDRTSRGLMEQECSYPCIWSARSMAAAAAVAARFASMRQRRPAHSRCSRRFG